MTLATFWLWEIATILWNGYTYVYFGVEGGP
jgi:hypothetical protein